MCAALTLGDGLAVSSVAIAVTTLACSIFKVGSASHLAAITTTLVLLVLHVSSPERMAAVRVAEVGWGVCVATAAVWVSERACAARRRAHCVRVRAQSLLMRIRQFVTRRLNSER